MPQKIAETQIETSLVSVAQRRTRRQCSGQPQSLETEGRMQKEQAERHGEPQSPV